jgi:2-keto-4-pentenoate hydratase/2-oxohepta-3-ene-1,7-dioic acid hydratase in catechol pathway
LVERTTATPGARGRLLDDGAVKIVRFTRMRGAPSPGVMTGDGIVDIGALVAPSPPHDPQAAMRDLISRFDDLRDDIERLVRRERRIPAGDVRLLAPLPRPTTLLCCIANYWEHAQREARPLNMFLKNPDAVIGPGDTIVLPEFDEPWIFMHEAELALVVKGPAKDVAERDWQDAVFGYTGLIDVTARGEGRITWRPVSWMGKSFDGFAPIGPCIVTADEIADPNDLHIRLWNDGELRHNYSTDDMEHRVPALVAFATSVMTLQSGDLIACGTNHEGLGAIQGGEVLELDIEGVGRMSVGVADPLGRAWDRGVYAGADSTNRELVRHRPRA